MATDSFTYQLLSIQEDGRQQAILKQNLLKPVIACKSVVTRGRWMADFLGFAEGNVS
jgi:hypothetical protein